ncbi:MAG: DUF4388 domain-containing protein [Deltaproteobacteria bacterium]|nr:DUF4388 domain-containing protein [Deltaproteobacteria bacterium]
MSLQGTLDTMPIVDLLLWMTKRNQTGILKFKRPSVTKSLTIEAGKVINAASTDPREYFGQFLINFGLLDEDQLQKAFETQQETRVLLGRILVMTGLLTEQQVHQVLELKIRETFLDTFLWDDGVFEFHDGLVPDEPSVVHVALDLFQLYNEGVARRNDFARIRQIIPDKRCTFSVHDQAITTPPEPGSPTGVMLGLARMGLSAADIILRFHSLDYPILRSLSDMCQSGWLEVHMPSAEPAAVDVLSDLEVDVDLGGVDAAAQPEPAPAQAQSARVELRLRSKPAPAAEAETGTASDRYLLDAQASMQGQDFARAVRTLKAGLQEHPYDPELCEALETAEHGLTRVLRKQILSAGRVPRLLRPEYRDSADLTPNQRYLLSRIDGQRDLRSIIMVSPIKELDVLLTVQSLVKAGILGMG